MKENSPFRSWHMPLARRPRTHRHRASVPRLFVEHSCTVAEAGSGSTARAHMRASTARRSTEDEKLFSRMSAVFKDGVLPELNDEWQEVMVRQMGMPAQFRKEKPPSLETLDRAKRCALVPPPIVPAEPLDHIFSAPGSTRPKNTPDKPGEMQLLKDFKPRHSLSGAHSKSRLQARADSAIRLARLSRPSTRHVNSKGNSKSISPRKMQEEGLTAASETPEDGERVRTAVEPPRVIDDEEPPFQWPDLLWATQDRLHWEKNGGRPKPPKNEKDDSKFKWYWNKLSDDEHYLHGLTLNNAYRGRVKANSLSEDELKQAKMKAQQVRYMWVRHQIKAEEHAVKHEKVQKKLELKRKKEEEALLLAETLRAEREAERRKMLFRITEQVFRALCTDPETGLPIDPRVIFRRLDTDGGGTVDIDEFREGLEVCGCELSDEELDLVWQEIDGADGESDGQVDHETLVQKLREVNEAQLALSKPKLIQVLSQN